MRLRNTNPVALLSTSLQPSASLIGLGLRVAWRPRGLSKWVISRVISTLNGVTLVITLLITDLLSPLGLQVSALNPQLQLLNPTP